MPARQGIKAYMSHPCNGLVEETMIFCPAEFERWISFDDDRIARGIHYRDLHVGIDESPSEQQKGKISTLLGSSNINAATGRSREMMWLANFLTATMIHESTHPQAFAGGQNTLIDVRCADGDVATSSLCMRAIAKGARRGCRWKPQGVRDVEMFSVYAMIMYTNEVHWFKYRPAKRGT